MNQLELDLLMSSESEEEQVIIIEPTRPKKTKNLAKAKTRKQNSSKESRAKKIKVAIEPLKKVEKEAKGAKEAHEPKQKVFVRKIAQEEKNLMPEKNNEKAVEPEIVGQNSGQEPKNLMTEKNNEKAVEPEIVGQNSGREPKNLMADKNNEKAVEPEILPKGAQEPKISKRKTILLKIVQIKGSSKNLPEKLHELEKLIQATVAEGVPLKRTERGLLDEIFLFIHQVTPILILANEQFVSLMNRHSTLHKISEIAAGRSDLNKNYGRQILLKYGEPESVLDSILMHKTKIRNEFGMAIVMSQLKTPLAELISPKTEKIKIFNIGVLCPIDIATVIKCYDLTGPAMVNEILKRKSPNTQIWAHNNYINELKLTNMPEFLINKIRTAVESGVKTKFDYSHGQEKKRRRFE